VRDSILIGVFVLTRTATNLQNTANARILKADIFGQLVGSAAGISTYVHPAYSPINATLPGPTVPATFKTDAIGSVTEFTTREMNKADIGLGNVDNTSDADKPISDAAQDALDDKADSAYVDEVLDSKADITYVDAELAEKADITYVNAELAKKADVTYVNSELAKKVNYEDLEPVSFSYPLLWVMDGVHTTLPIPSGGTENWLLSKVNSVFSGVSNVQMAFKVYPDQKRIEIREGYSFDAGQEILFDLTFIYN
jgi:hypothetical protein